METTWTTQTVLTLLGAAAAVGGVAVWVAVLRERVSKLERELDQAGAARTSDRRAIEDRVARTAQLQGERLGDLEAWIREREARERALAGKGPAALPGRRRPTAPAISAVPSPVPSEGEGSGGEEG